jgi:hypothetical protein
LEARQTRLPERTNKKDEAAKRLKGRFKSLGKDLAGVFGSPQVIQRIFRAKRRAIQSGSHKPATMAGFIVFMDALRTFLNALQFEQTATQLKI